jgi:hypothetical protein
MAVAYAGYLVDGQKVEKLGPAIGFPRPPC